MSRNIERAKKNIESLRSKYQAFIELEDILDCGIEHHLHHISMMISYQEGKLKRYKFEYFIEQSDVTIGDIGMYKNLMVVKHMVNVEKRMTKLRKKILSTIII